MDVVDYSKIAKEFQEWNDKRQKEIADFARQIEVAQKIAEEKKDEDQLMKIMELKKKLDDLK